MIRVCLFLLAGMYAPQLSSFVVDSDQVSTLLVAGIALCVVRQLRGPGFFLLGAGLFAGAAYDVVEARISPQFVGDSILATIRIDGFPKRSGQSASFVVVPVDDARLPERIRVSWFEPPVNLHPGDIWRLELRLRRPRGTSNAGAFDFEAWLTRERIAAVAYVVNSRRNYLVDSGNTGVIMAVRKRFVGRVAALAIDPERASVLAALVVGARHLMTDAQWDRYARSGTSHLMAISGLHIGLAAGGGYLLTIVMAALLGGRANHHALAIAVSIVVAAAYALISGLAVPSRRACLMITLAGVALLRRRLPRPANVVSVTGAAIAVLAPLATMAPGFMLSFAAVVVLLWAGCNASGAGGRFGRRQVLPVRFIRELAHLQILLLLGLLPITVLTFDRIVFAAPPVNLVAVPVFSLVTVPLSLIGLLLDGPLQFIGDRMLLIAAGSIDIVEAVIALAVSQPLASQTVPEIAGVAWLYLMLPLVWVVAPPGWPGRGLAWIGLAGLMLYMPQRPQPGCASVHVLDVGQGLATVVETRKSVLVFDTGPSFRSGGSMAEWVVLPFLESRGIKRIDSLVISHADLDHAGGVPAIDSALVIGELLTGEAIPDTSASQRPCRAGSHWRRDGVNFHILHPPAGWRADGNDRSCVLRLDIGQLSLLMTGDIERPAENRLLRAPALAAVDVVIVPHHGSRTSSSRSFVQALQPELAVVSAGFGNQWGFPKQDIVDRWQEAGAKVLVTATSGAIGLQLCADAVKVRVREHRTERRRIWNE